MNNLLQHAQELIEEHLQRVANVIAKSLQNTRFAVGAVGSWYNQTGILNAHLALFDKEAKEPVECIVGLNLATGSANINVDVCLQDGTILYSVGDYSFTFSDEQEFLRRLDNICQVANEGFLKYFAKSEVGGK